MEQSRKRPRDLYRKSLLIFIFTVLAIAVMGYHPGLEDDGIYLAAVKADLNPALFPHDADFFRLQLQASLFDRLIDLTVRATGLSIPWAELLWQFLAFYATLWAAHSIARALFPSARAQWAGVALLGALFTLPVAGTALNIADQHLHPRNIATALILFAVSNILARRSGYAIPLLLAALVIHPIMAAFGASFCVILYLTCRSDSAKRILADTRPVVAAVPMAWIFEPASPAWRRAVATRHYYFLSEWAWYEWLGAIGPLVLFWLLWRFARKGSTPLARFALAVTVYGVFQQVVALVMTVPPAFIRLDPLQPMRYLQLIYIFLVLVCGCLLGEYVLRSSMLRWAAFLMAANGGMFAAQRAQFPASTHLELPGIRSSNPWLQAFAWIRANTPTDAYFVLDPNYLAAPGEDYHCFRALAERSQLADAIKDAAVATQVPSLAPIWAEQVDAQAGFRHFELRDFLRLRARYGVNWTVVSDPPAVGLVCPWHNASLAVCRIPESIGLN